MTATWERVGPRYGNPNCQICGKDDYCTFSPELKLILCMRIESGRPSNNSLGGYLHPMSGTETIPAQPRVKSRPKENLPPPNFEAIWTSWQIKTTPELISSFADFLGVSPLSLQALNCVWSGEGWAIPMKNAQGSMIGMRMRSLEGNKFAVRGSKTGLFIPFIGLFPLPSTIYITEGPTDTAAALTLGLFAVGRPSCSACVEMIREFIEFHQKLIRNVVIIGDNDDRRCPKCKGIEKNESILRCPEDKLRYIQPGLDGAKRLRENLQGVHTSIWTPPCKDLREYLRKGGQKDLIR